jgi:putative tryptophan/tyrosine transport system substrate-binding protein
MEDQRGMRRRRFLTALGAVLLSPGVGLAQPAERSYRVGWLDSTGGRNEPYQLAFVQRLGELGFAEGRNLVIEFRTTQGRAERLPELAADLARQRCDVLLAPGTEPGLVALEKATRDVPIVIIANDYDPVAAGHVVSLARPGGRITGVSQLQSELPVKRLELLKDLLPKIRRVAVLSDVATVGQLHAVEAGAPGLGVTLHVTEFKSSPYDYESAFAESVRARAQALLALVSGNFVPARRLIPELALKHNLPSMFGNYLWAEAGGLMSYGPDFSEFYRRAAEKVALILNGTKPAEVPLEQPSAVELVINLKTAKALGLTVPPALRVRASRLIE